MRSSTSFSKGHTAWNKGLHVGARSEEVIQKIIDTNNRHWEKKRNDFFETNPICSSCKEELQNFTRIMLCDKCRCYKNHQNFKINHPHYSRDYNKRNGNRRPKPDSKREFSIFDIYHSDRLTRKRGPMRPQGRR